MMRNPLFTLVEEHANGRVAAIPSYCTANELAIEGVLAQAARSASPVLIEGTSNQVNQFGGYTGMKPSDFRDYVYGIADRLGFDRSLIMLGGDHLGPQPFRHLPEATAMDYAEEMVRQYVLAGYTKIHLDTSMRVADDDSDARLSDSIIARRGARLMKAAEAAFLELQKENPDAIHPVFIIGSEVPIPGGAQDSEELCVTSPDDLEATVAAYRQAFAEEGISELMDNVIAIVVQPGVEFGDADVHPYNRAEVAGLCSRLAAYPSLVFEGHSTDYQSPANLREMAEDGIAILKVGPALTFAVREALFALSHIEDELVGDASRRSAFRDTVETVMVENPSDWKKYYHGTEDEQAIKRAYSYSDRSRYYMGDKRIKAAMDTLFENLSAVDIPMGQLHQYLPLQYVEVRDGRLPLEPRALVLDAVRVVCDDYNFAAGTAFKG